MDLSTLLPSPLVLAGASTAFVAGLTGSLHCGLMCGPLASVAAKGPHRAASSGAWHFGRVAAYTSVGAALGAAGHAVSLLVSFSVQPYLPWLMAAGLVVTGLDLGRHLKPLPGVGRISTALARLGARLPPWGRAAGLGAATPFLPCGLLYGIFLSALATDSILGGALVMAAFSLGAIPLLAAVQLGARGVDRWPTAGLVLRRAVPLVAAAVLIARALIAKENGPQCH